jgi:hypothetical protein
LFAVKNARVSGKIKNHTGASDVSHSRDFGAGATQACGGPLFQEQKGTVGTLERRDTSEGNPSADPRCQTPVRPVVITPTHVKDYRNPHIARIRYGAAQALRQADRVHVGGCSLPPDDVDVVCVLKRNMRHLAAPQITIVESDSQRRLLSEHDVGRRDRGLLEDGIGCVTDGFASYSAKSAGGLS